MTERDEATQDDQSTHRTTDDRRGDVKPTDNPVPSSPQADEEAVREGEEKLERVKPY